MDKKKKQLDLPLDKPDEKTTIDLAQWEPETMVIEFEPDFDVPGLEEDEVIEFTLDPIPN